ncbi:MAG: hypothetical protein A2428_05280 [Bdellovibrionales bacterium RIFOXYC1_FULL_54_43]|nr:MAG: hypothetical protein A2428_05280 [Bdellovibrionales bacterium RIFOXYC1_FULL_54_43]OFZ84944.1 MAG: hypothetical protein A2603_05240 [Bdellovibrionales bacterium RIFOXYD1_FULL_55_31]
MSRTPGRYAAAILSFLISALCETPGRAAPPPPPVSPLIQHAQKLIKSNDSIGFRCLVKKAYQRKITRQEWYSLRALVVAQADRSGFDLVRLWNARLNQGKSELDRALDNADQLMLKGKFEEAFAGYQKCAVELKKDKTAGPIFPYVLHSMGRALYGAKRFSEALTVYSWIPRTYPRFRQIMFEKMWTAFRLGRVETALGAIASQRSAYFSPFLSPEAYLIQTYIYRRLCRQKDLNQVLGELRNYEQLLSAGALKSWAGSDTEATLLLRLRDEPISPENTDIISLAEKKAEQKSIGDALQRTFQKQRPKFLADIKTVLAYAHLAGATDTALTLKPIKKLTSREALLKMNLEIWPADSAEEWVDEIGSHEFIGESLCQKAFDR